MAENTKIELADHKWTPWRAVKDTRRKTSDANWRKLLAWNRRAIDRQSRRIQVYCEHPMCDIFEGWDGPIVDMQGEQLARTMATGYKPLGAEESLPRDWTWATFGDLRRDLFRLIDATPNLDWLLFTAWSENIRGMIPARYGGPIRGTSKLGLSNQAMYRHNVRLLYSASDQATLEAGLPHAQRCEIVRNLDLGWIKLADPKGGDPAEWPEELRVQQYRDY